MPMSYQTPCNDIGQQAENLSPPPDINFL